MTNRSHIYDPVAFFKTLWPGVFFYSHQRDVIYSVVENKETYVPAGNKLGKDFVAGGLILWFFMTRNPVRIVTTSARDDHLRVLWGEIERFVNTCAYSLDLRKGGCLRMNHQDIRKAIGNAICPISYVKGMVASPDTIAAMQGHHANPSTVEEANDGVPRTLFVADECSSVPTEYKTMAQTWYQRALFLGNTWPCANFWEKDVEAGDIERPEGSNEGGKLRKIVRITAEDSPNVRLGLNEQLNGWEPSGRVLVPGVKTWNEFLEQRATLDPMEAAVILYAQFYKGAEVMLFPTEWLTRSRQLAASFEADEGKKRDRRTAKAIGIDPAEGGDKTSMCAVDEYGVLDIVSKKTPRTDVVTAEAIAFMKKWNCPPESVIFDRGGGGKQHADRLRQQGYDVRTVAFGSNVDVEPKRGMTLFPEKFEAKEDRYTYKNRRAQMYGELSVLLDPSEGDGFAIPARFAAIFEQLRPIPKKYDPEGRLVLPPKNKRSADSKEVTLVELIGHSPDEADALVLAVHGMLHAKRKPTAGAPEGWR